MSNPNLHVCMPAAEKNLKVLRDILLKLPTNTCLCFVGDGPARAELEEHFKGHPVHFTVCPHLERVLTVARHQVPDCGTDHAVAEHAACAVSPKLLCPWH